MTPPPYVDPPTERLPRVAPRPVAPPRGHQHAYGPPAGMSPVPQQRAVHPTNVPAALPAPRRRSKRPILAGGVLAVIGILALLGLDAVLPKSTTSTSTSAAPYSSSGTSTSSSSLTSAEQVFVRAIDGQRILAGASDDRKVTVGKLVCETFDEGDSVGSTGRVLMSNGLDEYEAGFVIGAAVAAFCPEHTASVRAAT